MLAPSPSQQSEQLPYGLVSLWEMLEFRATGFVRTLRVFQNIETLVEHKIGQNDNLIVDASRDRALRAFQDLEQECMKVGAIITADFVRDAMEDLTAGNMRWMDMAASTKHLYSVLEKELGRAKLFAVSPQKTEYFTNALDRFEDEVWLSFGSIQDDVDEAGKCFALGRNTACVFHLMRVLEHPIAALAKVLLPDDPTPNWGTVLTKIDAELAKKPKERCFQGDVQYFAEVAAEMRAVQHAWRNRVMHVDPLITEERAKAIFDATIGFMNAVSKKLDENGLIDPNFELDLETPALP